MPFPRDIVTEIYVGGRWVEIKSDAYERDPVTITRGRDAEASGPERSTCRLAINNRSGNYSPRNPIGPYYGSLNRNTPLRLGIRTVVDTFSRTATDSWGAADTGETWTVDAPASGWDVAGGVGTISVPAANNFKDAFLAGVSHRDIDVAVTATMPVSDVTGNWLRFGAWVRGQSLTDFVYAAVEITTAEAVRIGIFHFSGTAIAAYVTVPGITHSGSQALRLRFQSEGQTYRAKVWVASAGEPYDWQVTGHSDLIDEAGHVGVWVWSGSGNTNSYPIVCSVDDFVITHPRAAQEVAEWPQRWDLSGNDKYVPIEAAGILRRLGQGASPVTSPLRRGLLADPDVVAYWPCEDDPGSTTLASALPGALPMIIHGSPDLASNTDFAASAPIPTLKGATFAAHIPAHTVVDKTQVRMLVSVPDSGVGGDIYLAVIGMSGSCRAMYIAVNAAGDLGQAVLAADGSVLYNSTFVDFNLNGSPRWLSAEFSQNGANVDVNIVTVEPGASVGGQFTGSIIGQTCGIPTYIQGNPDGLLDNEVIAHISVHRKWSSLFALGSQLAAWDGETAGARIQRLCEEDAIAFSYTGDLAHTAAMGPQRTATLLELLAECAEADMGELSEPRGELGLSYRTRASLYNQPAAVPLDYAAGHISAPFEPVDDDRNIRNDITIKRVNGSSARAVLRTGRMSVLPPKDGGVGRYDHEPPALNLAGDDQLPDIAGWQLRHGTVDEERYPAITIDLTTPGVVAAGLEPQVLDLTIGERLTVDNLPAGQPPDQVSQIVLGYTETINLFEHQVTANCAPASPYEVLRFDDGVSKWDSAASTLNAGLNDTDASFAVAIGGTLWTTDPAQMPILIMVGGEQMSVGAISGTSSPQTFSSVSRSVNGVVKSHSSGAQVRLARRAAIAL